MGIATSQSHSEVLQDMVLNLSSAEGKRDIEHEKNVLKDLVKEMVQFRYAQLLQALPSIAYIKVIPACIIQMQGLHACCKPRCL